MRPLTLVLVGVVVASGLACRSRSTQQQPLPPQQERLARIQEQEWRRLEHDAGALKRALADPAPAVRARAALAVGRMGLVVPAALAKALDDPSSDVRGQAAFALSLLASKRPGLRDRAALALRSAAQREQDDAVGGQILLSIGHIGRPADGALLEAAFGGPRAVAAVRAWGLAARRNGLDRQSGGALASALGAKDRQLSRVAAWAASQRGPQGDKDPLWDKLLVTAAGHADDPTRLWAMRAIAKQGARRVGLTWLLARLRDPSAGVRQSAAAAFSQRGVRAAVKLCVALRLLWREAGANHHRLTGTSVFPVLSGLSALERHARVATIRQFAADMLYLSDASDAAIRYLPTEALSVDRVHCAAARLWDLGVERIERTPTCGTAHAPDLTPSWRRRHVISTVAAMTGRDAEWKMTLLRRYLRDGDPAVREAAVTALAHIEHPALGAALTRALDDADRGVLGAAFARIAAQQHKTFAPTLAREVAKRVEALKPLANPLLVCDGVRALGQLGARFALPLLDQLRRSPAAALRRCTARALVQLQPNARHLTHPPAPSRGLPDLRWMGGDDVPLPRRAVLVTRRGEVQIELFPDRAPAAVACFARHAVKRGFQHALFWARREGALVAGVTRSPRWQSTGFTLPDEPSTMPAVAGLLGTARERLEGRPAADSASRAFFVTLEARADLAQDTTIFGRVRSGLEILQATHPGEQIKDLYIPTPPPGKRP